MFVKTDVYGDSVFTYERIDPAYSFTGYNNLDYEYSFLTDPAAQNQLLDVVEEYLGSCNKNLYPQVILLTNSYSKTDQRERQMLLPMESLTTYRSLLLSYTPDEEVLESLANEIMKTFIIQQLPIILRKFKASIECRKDFIGMRGVLGVSNLKSLLLIWNIITGGIMKKFQSPNFLMLLFIVLVPVCRMIGGDCGSMMRSLWKFSEMRCVN
ncbi:MAG: hypothetical protein ACLU30_15935 [Odoribacter splanchnicus]